MAASDVKFEGIHCDACCRRDITGTRWKCEVCYDYDLCNDCYKRGKHYQDHPFLRLKKPGGSAERVPPRKKSNKFDRTTIVRGDDRFDGIRCDACHQRNIPGIRWKCDVCVDYDLCLDCYMDKKHASHAFLRYDRPNGRSITVPPRQLSSDVEAGAMQHDGIICNGCREDGIFGTRWKCLLCYDYDLCNSCYAGGTHNQEHAFLKLSKPGGIATRVPPRKTTARSQLSYFTPGAASFLGPLCDGCCLKNLPGARWKCDVCVDYNLCTDCYTSNKHRLDHGFLRFDSLRGTGVSVPPRKPFTKTQPKLSHVDFVDLRNPPQRKKEAPTRTEVDHAAQREQDRELRQMKESLDCSICLERRRNVAFLCGHSACAHCAEYLSVCHMCRVPIERKITLY
ncbi:hypothetical protein MTO96_023508 [Rhipicephalus appendiculatus]